ncbi:MAG TPA: hypothetical protein VFW40_04575 [Capsulimonadaceae bacterium]|nr:hypothetical protein [Capsulimonadaceae bacterium]
MTEIDPLREAIFDIPLADLADAIFHGKPIRLAGLPADANIVSLSVFHDAYRANPYSAPLEVPPDRVAIVVNSRQFEERDSRQAPPRIEVTVGPVHGDCAGCAALQSENDRLKNAHNGLSHALEGLAEGLQRAAGAAKQTVREAAL